MRGVRREICWHEINEHRLKPRCGSRYVGENCTYWVWFATMEVNVGLQNFFSHGGKSKGGGGGRLHTLSTSRGGGSGSLGGEAFRSFLSCLDFKV